ncbi:MAG: DNA translocase FtsK [Planctomycetes bacterium]|nr:DNA translocase FtsK [Planctomycetota bacterium]
MATTRKKSRQKKSKSKKKNGASQQFGFVFSGLNAVLSLFGAGLIFLFNGVKWAFESTLDALYGNRGRQPFGIALACLSLFMLGAILSYESGDKDNNLCGVLGYTIADSMLFFLGVGAFVIPCFGAFWGVARLAREESSGYAGFKLVGICLLSLSAAFIGHGIGDTTPTNVFMQGEGGWLGSSFYPTLSEVFGPLGTTLVISFLVSLSLLMATEWAFVPLVRDLLKSGADRLRQQDLPWGGAAEGSLVKDAKENHQKASRGISSIFGWLGKQFSAYDITSDGSPSATEPAAAMPEPANDHQTASSPEIKISGPGYDEEPKIATPAAKVEPAKVVSPTAQPTVSAPSAVTATAEKIETEDKPARAIDDENFSLPGMASETKEQSTARIETEEEKAVKPKRRKTPSLKSLPSINLLVKSDAKVSDDNREEINELGRVLQSVLDSFKLDAQVVTAERGPTITMFGIQLAAGVPVAKIKKYTDDIGLQLGTDKVRIVFPLPNSNAVGVEVPNSQQSSVRLRDVFEKCSAQIAKASLPMVLGQSALGSELVGDLAKMPHMLVAGTTGSGKSVCLNSILATLLLTRTPEEVRFILIDPKQVELDSYSGIPHLMCPVVTDMKRASKILSWTVDQMESRLTTFKRSKVRNISDYNAIGRKGLQKLLQERYDENDFPDTFPYVVVVIDELADLMLTHKKDVETSINRIAAKARAAGIHLIVATQRPSTDVVTGLIKANLPVRMSFRVNTAIDSRVILDEMGGEKLLGNGDFLYRPPGAAANSRGQGAFIDTPEVNAICDHLRENGQPEYVEDLEQGSLLGGSTADCDDEYFMEAVEFVLKSGRGSASLMQRKYGIGYSRASRLIENMTAAGVLGEHNGAKPREILITLEQWEAMKPK